MEKSVSLVITVNYFIQFMRQATLLFRDATGTFYYDRWKPLVEGVLNIGLSIGFVYLFKYVWGDGFAVVGVIAATIVTDLTICHVVEPYVLYKYALQANVKSYYFRNYFYIAFFVGLLFALHFSMISSDNQWVELFANGGISLAYSLSISAIVALVNKDFRHYIKSFLLRFKSRNGNSSLAATAVDANESDVEQYAKIPTESEDSINTESNSDIIIEKDADKTKD